MSATDEMGLTKEAAKGYEEFFVPAIFHQWPSRLLANAAIKEGEDVLDVGCGTGVLTREVPKHVGESGSVTGFDLSESMLSVARSVCPGTRFHQGDCKQLPFEDESFDVVVSSFMLMFVPDPAKALAEMWRVLRPDGRIVTSVWLGLDHNPVYRALVEATAEIIDKPSADAIAWPFSMGDVVKLAGVFDQAGIRSVSMAEHDGTATFPSVHALVTTEIQSWLLADKIDSSQLGKITAGLIERYPDFNDSDASITFPLNALIARSVKAPTSHE